MCVFLVLDEHLRFPDVALWLCPLAFLQLSFGGMPYSGKPLGGGRKNFKGCMESINYNGDNVTDLARRKKLDTSSFVSKPQWLDERGCHGFPPNVAGSCCCHKRFIINQVHVLLTRHRLLRVFACWYTGKLLSLPKTETTVEHFVMTHWTRIWNPKHHT